MKKVDIEIMFIEFEFTRKSLKVTSCVLFHDKMNFASLWSENGFQYT